MANPLRFLVVLFAALVVALGLALASPSAPAYAQACDPSGSRDGTAEPSTITPGGTITFTAINMSANEEVSFWFTRPDGAVAGTAAPLCCAGADGRVLFAPTQLPPSFYLFPGKWALTVEGASSHHQSIIYFCLVTQQQPTPPPPTATTAPPPPTATTAPTAEATATTVPPTVEASPTTAAASPTSEATAVATSVPTVEATATTAAPPTVAVPPTAAPTLESTPTPGVIGMPVTGGSGGNDSMLYIGLVLVALSMLAIGLMARRSAPDRR